MGSLYRRPLRDVVNLITVLICFLSYLFSKYGIIKKEITTCILYNLLDSWITNDEVKQMKELVGNCAECDKEIYCLEGFINGVVLEDKKGILCFDCAEE